MAIGASMAEISQLFRKHILITRIPKLNARSTSESGLNCHSDLPPALVLSGKFGGEAKGAITENYISIRTLPAVPEAARSIAAFISDSG